MDEDEFDLPAHQKSHDKRPPQILRVKKKYVSVDYSGTNDGEDMIEIEVIESDGDDESAFVSTPAPSDIEVRVDKAIAWSRAEQRKARQLSQQTTAPTTIAVIELDQNNTKDPETHEEEVVKHKEVEETNRRLIQNDDESEEWEGEGSDDKQSEAEEDETNHTENNDCPSWTGNLYLDLFYYKFLTKPGRRPRTPTHQLPT